MKSIIEDSVKVDGDSNAFCKVVGFSRVIKKMNDFNNSIEETYTLASKEGKVIGEYTYDEIISFTDNIDKLLKEARDKCFQMAEDSEKWQQQKKN